MRLGVVILAAGASRRMGRPKLLLPWKNGVVMEHLIGEWRAIGAEQIVAVVSKNLPELDQVLDEMGIGFESRLVNAEPERGMFSSIQLAASWVGWKPELTHIVITLGDQPHVKRDTLEALATFGESHPGSICQPARAGRAKHPVLLSREAFRQIAKHAGPTLAHFLAGRSEERLTLEIDDPGLDFDLDRPEDYERAR